MNQKLRILTALFVPLAWAGCVNIDTSKPIHVVIDVNVKVDKARDNFSGDLAKKSTTIEAPKPKEDPKS